MGVEAGAGLALSACHLSVQIATVTMTSRATMCWAYCAEDPVLSLSQTGSLSGSPLELPSLVCSSHVSFNVQRTHQARFHLRAFAPAVPLPKCSPPQSHSSLLSSRSWLWGAFPTTVYNHMVLDSTPHSPSLLHFYPDLRTS